MFYIEDIAHKAKEGLSESIVHTNGLKELSGMTQDTLSQTGSLGFAGSPSTEPESKTEGCTCLALWQHCYGFAAYLEVQGKEFLQ